MDNLLKQFAQSSQLNGGNASYVEDLYEQYLVAPDSVGPKWKAYFDGFKGHEAGDVPHSVVIQQITEAARQAANNGHVVAAGGDERERNIGRLITAYRSRGHLGAQLDPLGLTPPVNPPDLDLSFHNLSDKDLDSEFSTGNVGGNSRMKLRDLLARLKAAYTGPIGVEFMHISEVDQRQWLYQRLETAGGQFGLSDDAKRRTLERLTAAEGLERYLHTKYVGQKRFSLEGGDALIPLLDTMIRSAGEGGVKDIVVGMAHRGRLNVLVNTLGKSPRKLFDEFEGKFEHDNNLAHAGDVKYHMGFSADIATPGGPVHLALAFNPSHLEIVDPVVAGSVRSRQERRNDAARQAVLPIIMHGDAAFAGQGVVMELFQMSQARGFAVGGTLHIVINNQIGFTTSNKEDARSTLYCTDVAKMVGAPVFHVNGDDPEAVVFVAQLAYDFRQQFKKDVVIDLVCYRRHGHNEADEPAATQPVMYQTIRKHATTREMYAAKLEGAGVIPAEGGKALADAYRDKLDSGEYTTELAKQKDDELAIDWSKYLSGKLSDPVDTKVKRKSLDSLAKIITTIPAGVALHPRVAKIYEDRVKMAAGEQAADWGFAENLAYATLLAEGNGLRLVGQDAGRGTFFHRHAILHDQKTDSYYLPLRQLVEQPEQATIIDSLLSEEAVMAFEYGFSTTDPNTLCIWEAQFGDFANGAQVVIDQFIAAGEAKWGRISGLTLLLPHGYEGQGPDHSSARIERFLQLAAEDNMTIARPSTPASYFHLLRRQAYARPRRPLVVFTPKAMLRLRGATSDVADFTSGKFEPVLDDARITDGAAVRRVLVHAGKIHYDLKSEIEKRGTEGVALVRLEQLYPLPAVELQAVLDRYPNAEIVWVQDEPENQGAWPFFALESAKRSGPRGVRVISRPASASPATGSTKRSAQEHAAIMDAALAE
ncbi:2-oxoglutarate dehydrogenase E1 component [Pseudoxanthomonas sp.]|uniref:2-oxoglutarate dehydrogenase E1 component n=1 Tax=Pseudoxanthomonas sp. TaxID=1871049 RepID=UPI0031B5CCDA